MEILSCLMKFHLFLLQIPSKISFTASSLVFRSGLSERGRMLEIVGLVFLRSD